MRNIHFVLWISIIQMTALMGTTATPYRTTQAHISETNQNNQRNTENIGDVNRRNGVKDDSMITMDGTHNSRMSATGSGSSIHSTNEPDERTSSTRRGKRDSDIRFPEEEAPFVPVAGGTFEPKCAKGSTFCEDVDEYPSLHVDLLLKQEVQKYDDLFGEDLVMPDNIINRYNGIDEEESLCNSIEKVVYPKVAEKYDNTWAYIINQPNHTQGVRVEECVNTNQKCEMSQSFPIGYESKCKQKFIYRQLIALDKYGNSEKSLFRLPSCCQCVLIRTDDRNKRSINFTSIKDED